MNPKTVMLVDDSRVARMMARHVIAKALPDWRITEAASGEEALALAAQDRPDFIVLDINMPGIDGLETACRLKTMDPTLVITLLTANSQDPVRAQANILGLSFLNKPVRDDALLAFLTGGAS